MATAYTGALGSIFTEALALFNEERGGSTAEGFISDAYMLICANRCLHDLAMRGVFKTTGLINLVAAQSEYNLLTLFPRIVAPFKLHWTADNEPITPVGVSDDLLRWKAAGYTTGDRVYWYWLNGLKLNVLPVPTANATGALTIHYTTIPNDFTGPDTATLDDAPAVDLGGGLVGLPATAHGLSAGFTVEIVGTVNYDGTYVLDTTTSTNQLVVEATFVSETIATAIASYAGNVTLPEMSLARRGVFVEFLLAQFHRRDRTGTNSAALLAAHEAAYHQEVRKLIADMIPPGTVLRSY